MLRIKFDFSLCVVIELLLVFGIVIGTIMQVSSLISLCFYLSFLVLLAYAFKRALSVKFGFLPLLLVFLTVISVLINGWLSPEASWGFSYFKKMFMFIAFCLFFYFVTEDDIDVKCGKSIRRMPILMAVLLVVSYYSGFNERMLGRYLTLGFTNPNFTGMWLLHFFIFAFLGMIDKCETKTVRIISALLLLPIVHLITMTKSRSCLLALVAYGGFCLAAYVVKNRRRMRWISVIALFFPLLFALAYQYLLTSVWFVDIFEVFSAEGKGLDSRSGVWISAIEAIQGSPLWGDYSGISDGTGMSQMHNIYLDVFASYGLGVGVLFFVLLLGRCNQIIDHADNFYQYCAMSGFLAVIIMGTFEAAMVSGAMGMNILTALLVALVRQKQNGDLDNWNLLTKQRVVLRG